MSKKKTKRNSFDKDTWNLFEVISRFALPRIKRYKQLMNGWPCDLTEKKWDDILDEMIFAMDYVVNDGERKLFKKYPFPDKEWELLWEDDEKKPGYKIYNPKYNKKEQKMIDRHIAESRKINKRVQDAFELFGKYFWNLWW